MIGFASWFADDPSKRKEGLNQMRHDMELVAGLGGRIYRRSCSRELLNWIVHGCRSIPERYRAILDLGDEMGVPPILELYGEPGF